MADALLATPAPGRGFWPAGLTNYDIVRRAARQLLDSCVTRVGTLTAASLFDRLDAITSQHYEGAAATGRIILARDGHPSISQSVRLRYPIPVRYYRSLRKLLEMTDPQMAMLCDGEYVFGLGSTTATPPAQDIFDIEVHAHATWKLHHDSAPIMQVEYGKAALPKPAVSRSVFDSTMRLRFPAATATDVDRTWQCVKAAVAAEHGSILVITTEAQAEARRLAGQATLIDPVSATTELISHITRIDGAVLMDPEGTCYAMGAILDGTATPEGDPSRGARYNSAIRYLNTQTCPAVAIVVSSDGDVHVLPRLRPRVAHATIELAIEQLALITSLDPDPDPEAFSRAWRDIDAVSFYLTQEQCVAINTLVQQYRQYQELSGLPPQHFPELCPQAEMDDSYFTDQTTPAR
jgi:hypothetical protein